MSAKDRVIIEKEEIDKKSIALLHFFGTEGWKNLGRQQQVLLSVQYQVMQTYSSILGYRLEIWGD